MSDATPKMVALEYTEHAPADMRARAQALYAELARRRSVRAFSPRPVPRELVELAVRSAGTAPSGAHQQPWTWVVVSDAAVKAQIRAAAEREEWENYHGRMPPEWIRALAPLGTDFAKSHLTDAPYVVVLFRHLYATTADGGREARYYTAESCGIAAGLFLAAVHHMGLVTLTHTPSPMGFLREILQRPENEKAFLVMPVGYPAGDATVPDLRRRSLEEISVWI